MPLVRPDGADATAWSLVDATSAAGGAALRPEPGRRLLLRPAEGACRPTAGCGWPPCSPGGHRAHRAHRRRRTAGSRRRSTWHRPRQLAQGPDLQHAGAGHDLPGRRSRSEWINDNGGLEFAAGRCDESAEIIYCWAEAPRLRHAVRRRPRRRAATSSATIDLDESSTPPPSRAVLRANGIVDTDCYRKLGRNQLRIAMFPAIDPTDVDALTACIDFVVEQLG